MLSIGKYISGLVSILGESILSLLQKGTFYILALKVW